MNLLGGLSTAEETLSSHFQILSLIPNPHLCPSVLLSLVTPVPRVQGLHLASPGWPGAVRCQEVAEES